MRGKTNYWASLILFLVSLFFCLPGLRAEGNSLAKIYRHGRIVLKPEMIIDSSSLPPGVFFVGVASISFDSLGNLYFLDFRDNNIKKFDSAGKFLKIIGQKGQGPGDFSSPVSFDVVKDRIFVWDMGNRRLCALTLEGEAATNRDISGLSGRPRKLRALPGGDLVVETEKIHFDDPKKPQDVFLELLSPDLQLKRVIYSQPVWREKYIRTEQFGLTNLPQPFSPDIHWDISPDGRIIIGFAANYEFGIYNSQGNLFLSVKHPFKPAKITEKDKKKHFETMTFFDGKAIRRGVPDVIIKNTEFPEYKPAYSSLMVDGAGNILVRPFIEEEAKQKLVFDAFSPEGKFISRVELIEPEIDLFDRETRWQGNSVWIRKIEPDGTTKFTRYRIEPCVQEEK